MWSQKSQLSSAPEVGRVGRNKRHSPTLKLMDGVQKGLVKGRAVCKSFSFGYFQFSGCNEGSIKSRRHKKGTKSNQFVVIFFFLPFRFLVFLVTP